jgi:serine protease inhibitor
MTSRLSRCGIALGPALTCFVLAGLTAGGMGDTRDDTPGNSAVAVSAITGFGLRLLGQMAMQDSTSNILISPTGLSLALTMAYNGAAGETAREMAAVLDLEGYDPDEVNSAYASLVRDLPASGGDVGLEIANSLWADSGTPFRQEFLDMSSAVYRAAVEAVDLRAPEVPGLINAWVGEATHGHVGPIIDHIDPDVVLYIASAMYFEGRWAVPFDTSRTSLRDFTLPDGSTKAVPTMMAELGEAHYYVGDGFKAARLDYGDGRISMYLFLPDEASSLQAFYGMLNPDNWAMWLAGFETGPARLLLPRIDLEYNVVLNDALKALGMRRAFGAADFRRMTSARVFISMVKHSTRLEVTEQGTEAASVAVVEIKKGLTMQLDFTRPFCFAIADRPTGAILFLGTVTVPSD